MTGKERLLAHGDNPGFGPVGMTSRDWLTAQYVMGLLASHHAITETDVDLIKSGYALADEQIRQSQEAGLEVDFRRMDER